uniref:Uncharacterized protein n=1 Tax=Arundo donax TaxID=35708 RepID=A0A0A8YB22_ARUDO
MQRKNRNLMCKITKEWLDMMQKKGSLLSIPHNSLVCLNSN